MNFGKIVAGIGVLIALYLLISKADQTSNIISTIATNSIKGIEVLQGRSTIV